MATRTRKTAPKKNASPAYTKRKDGEEAKTTAPDKVLAVALKRYQRCEDKDRDNRLEGYDDLAFLAGDQWDEKAKQQRGDRPMLTINRLPQFAEQVTGDMRQMRPSIKCVAVDDRGDPKTAEVIAGMVRYIENRSSASEGVYPDGADSQVQAGIGHWKVCTEYADDSTFEQELRIEPVSDQLAIRWDPDSILKDRSDAMYCFEPEDMARERFEEEYPDHSPDTFGSNDTPFFHDWVTDDYVRVCRYWWKAPIKRRLVKLPNGGVDDLTGKPEKEAEAVAQGLQVEERPGHQIMHALVSASAVVDGPHKWPGRHIPVIPVIGREIRIGRKTYRYGLVRHAKDPQRLHNYGASIQVETLAQQPKSPWLVTDAMIASYAEEWEKANVDNLPYLRFDVDTAAPGLVPTRVQPPVVSEAAAKLLMDSAEAMHAVTGIYPASLGAKSNESSGRAILARQREGDTGSFVFVKNFGLSIKRTAEIIVDLIPHIYDTTRTIRVVGDDGKQDVVQINSPQGIAELPEGVDESETNEAVQKMLHDVTVGAYDIVFEMGPSFSSKSEAAREGMTAMVSAAPNIAPMVMDLIAKAQDWPLADKFAKRLRKLLPPEIQQMEAEEEGDPNLAPKPGPVDPNVQLANEIEQIKAQVEHMKAEIGRETAQLQLEKVQLERDNLLAQVMNPQEELPPGVAPEQLEGAVAQSDEKIAAVDEKIEQLNTAMEEIDKVLAMLLKQLQQQTDAQAKAQEQDAAAAAKQSESDEGDLKSVLADLAEALGADTEIVSDADGNPIGTKKVKKKKKTKAKTAPVPAIAQVPLPEAPLADAVPFDPQLLQQMAAAQGAPQEFPQQ